MKNLFIILITLSVSSQLTAQKGRPAKEKIQVLKVAVFTEELGLTPKEAKNFWPLYNEYDSKVRKIDKEIRRMSASLETKSDQEIETIMEKRFEFQEQKINLEREYYKKFKKIISLQKIAKIPVAQRKFKKRLVSEMQRHRQERRRGQ